jgi:hypothetical protein
MQDMDTRLYALQDLLDIGTYGYYIDIVLVFVYIIAEYLLALFIDCIHVVDDNQLLLSVNRTARSAECFHLGSEIIDALFLQIIDKEYIRFWYR